MVGAIFSMKINRTVNMKRIFQTGNGQVYLDFVLLVVRIAIAALMIRHGLPKLTKLMAGGEIQFANPLGLGATFSLILVVFSELFCSLLIAMGLGTRLAAIPLIITMLVIVFISHGDDPFARKELPLIYLLNYFVLLVMGSGRFSIDYLITRKS